MKKNKEETKMKTIQRLILTTVLILFVSSFSSAQPTGTDITVDNQETVTANPPGNRTDDGGTITTLVVNALQQNIRWKAYIGNVTGSLTLDDSSGSTIYNWELDQGDISGTIYSSRHNNIDWTDISCAQPARITSENTALNLTGIDSIDNTFNETTHEAISIAGQPVITQNTCPATSTFVGSTRQTQSTADFQLVLLESESTNIVYASAINPTTTGYDGSTYDFQMIVANNPLATTTYYFYVELG
ncbi:hypothetical protein KO361_00240 [Candidatus Woesearchaeota archaeon]|nr:hypothetical protein [Candidatus Woesearchaeota archaeon]